MDMSQKDSDKALIYRARMQIDSRDWTGAITTIGLLSAAYRASREVQGVLAGAYAGRCGLQMITLINNINTAAGGRLFQTLMVGFPGSATTNVNDCVLAESTLKGIGGAAVRTAEENLWMAFISLAKIGVILNRDADIDQNNVVDPAFDACNNANLSVATTNEIVSALGILFTSLTAAGSSIGGASLTNVQAACTLASTNLGPAFDFCSVTDTAAVTTQQRQAIRGLVRENSSVGLGTCVGDVSTCACGT